VKQQTTVAQDRQFWMKRRFSSFSLPLMFFSSKRRLSFRTKYTQLRANSRPYRRNSELDSDRQLDLPAATILIAEQVQKITNADGVAVVSCKRINSFTGRVWELP